MRSSRKPNSRSWLHRDLRRRQHSAYDLGHGSDRASGAINIRREKLMESLKLQNFEKLGPFEIKDELIKLAKKTSRTTQSAFLNAGRGNPNWIATTPRDGFFLLGQFALTESRRVMDHPAGIGGMPQAAGIAGRFDAWMAKHEDEPGAEFLRAMVPFAVRQFDFTPDA